MSSVVDTDSTGLRHECGVIGVVSASNDTKSSDVAQIVYTGLIALQHRGQESAGIVTSEGAGCTKGFHIQKGMGLITHVFKNEYIEKLRGNLGIGHTRYSTTATSEPVNCQPFVVHTVHGELAVAHNGELVNCAALRKLILERGVGLSTHSDSELITQTLCLTPPDCVNHAPDWPERIKHLMQLAPLSYSLVLLINDRIYGVRDPFGNRPLCLGKILPLTDILVSSETSQTDGWVLSSESGGFHSIGARYVREIEPGEIVEMSADGVRTVDIVRLPATKNLAFCIFEYVYFARPDSIFQGQTVYTARVQCGKQLAIEQAVDADIVSSVPESGNAAAHGFSKQSGIPFAEVLCKNRYVGRTFIQPNTRLRRLAVSKKFGVLTVNVQDKRIILIDDSIVRGNTIGPIIKLLKDAGAKEVHIRIASPPLQYPCYMGVNIPTREELIANRLNTEQLAKHVGAASLEYLSVDGLVKAVRSHMVLDTKSGRSTESAHCTACLTGEYPGGVPEELDW